MLALCAVVQLVCQSVNCADAGPFQVLGRMGWLRVLGVAGSHPELEH